MAEITKHKTSLFIAWRFIFSDKRLKAINIITRISILGVIIGVMTIVVVMSVLNGFQELARSLFLSVDSDIQVTAATGKHVLRHDSLLVELQSMPGIESAGYYIEDKAILVADEKSGVVMVKGLQEDALKRFQNYTDLAQPTDSVFQGLVLGRALAMKYDLYLQARIRLFGSAYLDEALDLLDQPFASPPAEPPVYEVSNFFSSHRNFDENYIILPLGTAHELLKYGHEWATGIDVRLAPDSRPEELQPGIESLLQTYSHTGSYQVTTLKEKYSQLFEVMELEKWGSFLVLMMIILVASLSLIGSLTMTSIEKKRDLYFLRCVGMQPRHIKQIFIFEGALIALLGVGIGIILGGAVCYLQSQYGLVGLPSQDAFIIDAYPVSVEWVDFAVVSLGAVLVCLVASLYPAARAIEHSETRATH